MEFFFFFSGLFHLLETFTLLQTLKLLMKMVNISLYFIYLLLYGIRSAQDLVFEKTQIRILADHPEPNPEQK